MTNKEIYDSAVKNGLEFTYFKGENICPDDFEDTVKETFWEMERDSAERNSGESAPAKFMYERDVENDAKETSTDNKRIPDFITQADMPDAKKIVAYDCYADLRYNSNGFGYVVDPEVPKNDDSYGLNLPYNWNRGFDSFFGK